MNFLSLSGDLCAAKFSDGEWYRAKVEKVSPTQVVLFFLDILVSSGTKNLISATLDLADQLAIRRLRQPRSVDGRQVRRAAGPLRRSGVVRPRVRAGLRRPAARRQSSISKSSTLVCCPLSLSGTLCCSDSFVVFFFVLLPRPMTSRKPWPPSPRTR